MTQFPSLPKPDVGPTDDEFGYTADQMNAHGLARYEAGRAAAAQATWQPISMAPKDDRLFDMTLEGVGRAVKVTFTREQISALVERLRAFGLLTPSPATSAAPQEADALREALLSIAQRVALATDECDDKAKGTHYIDKHGVIRCKGSFLALVADACAALAQHQPATLGDTK